MTRSPRPADSGEWLHINDDVVKNSSLGRNLLAEGSCRVILGFNIIQKVDFIIIQKVDFGLSLEKNWLSRP